MIPGPWEFALVALAAWRLWKLIAEDTITDPLRERWLPEHGWAADLVSCPYCLGAWIAAGWTGAFWLWPHWSVIVAVPFAVSAAVGVLATTVNRLADT